jgi:hypothetical protein
MFQSEVKSQVTSETILQSLSADLGARVVEAELAVVLGRLAIPVPPIAISIAVPIPASVSIPVATLFTRAAIVIGVEKRGRGRVRITRRRPDSDVARHRTGTLDLQKKNLNFTILVNFSSSTFEKLFLPREN